MGERKNISIGTTACSDLPTGQSCSIWHDFQEEKIRKIWSREAYLSKLLGKRVRKTANWLRDWELRSPKFGCQWHESHEAIRYDEHWSCSPQIKNGQTDYTVNLSNYLLFSKFRWTFRITLEIFPLVHKESRTHFVPYVSRSFWYPYTY